MNDASILVVEDDGLIALRSQELLTKSGFVVPDLFASGEEVLEYLERAVLPDLILMDIGLSGNLNGIETARKVREKYDIPVIFLSAYSNDQRIADARDVSPYGYIIKPFVEHQLLGCIHNALNR
jgi:two-component system, response regulator PdtaR